MFEVLPPVQVFIWSSAPAPSVIQPLQEYYLFDYLIKNLRPKAPSRGELKQSLALAFKRYTIGFIHFTVQGKCLSRSTFFLCICSVMSLSWYCKRVSCLLLIGVQGCVGAEILVHHISSSSPFRVVAHTPSRAYLGYRNQVR